MTIRIIIWVDIYPRSATVAQRMIPRGTKNDDVVAFQNFDVEIKEDKQWHIILITELRL